METRNKTSLAISARGIVQRAAGAGAPERLYGTSVARKGNAFPKVRVRLPLEST